jgi:hypothetical protein
MDEEKGREGGVAGNTADPRFYDPPKPVVVAEESSPLAAKIAKLSENLSATGALSGVAGPARAAAHPMLITSSSLDEARAYLPNIEPSRSDEPTTLEMQRVRIAGEVNVATWVTEKVDKSRLGLGAAGGDVARSGDVGNNDRIGEAVGGGLEAPGRGRGMRKAVLWGGLALGAAVLVMAFVLVGRGDPGRRLARSGPVLQVAQAAPTAWIKDLGEAVERASAMVAKPVVSPQDAATPTSEPASKKIEAPTPPTPRPSSKSRGQLAPSQGVPGKKTGAPGSVQGASPPTRVEQKEPVMAPEWVM